jgi:RNA polymerase sigma-70 factor (ECF subfamily)
VSQGGAGDQSEPDARVIEKILAGQGSLFEEIVRRYQRMVTSVAYRLGVPASDLEDLVSEVFLKAYRNLARYRPEHAFSTWLYRLATNRILDDRRQRRREGRSEPLDERQADTGPGADIVLDETERATVVARALEALPEEYRTPLVLLHMEGRKVSEISAVLSIPEGTVKTRLARGRERLKKILVRDFPEYAA